MVGYQIFNRFDESGEDLVLRPECRSTTAQAVAGFTCGSNPTLKTGTRVIVRDIPETSYSNDNRQVTILRSGYYSSLDSALEEQDTCPDHATDPTCPNIEFFNSCFWKSDTQKFFIITIFSLAYFFFVFHFYFSLFLN